MDKKYDLTLEGFMKFANEKKVHPANLINNIMDFYAHSIKDENEYTAYIELLAKWDKFSEREKLMGQEPTTEEIIELPQLIFKTISELPPFLYFVLSHMRVSCIDLTETTISDFTELDELRGFLSKNGMDFYEIVKLSHEAKISIIKGDLAKQTLPENEAVYRIILNALREQTADITFSHLLVDSIPECIRLLPVTIINIDSCQNLNNLSSLSKCHALRSLTIDSCDQLTSLSGLAEPCSVKRYTLDSYKHLVETPDNKEYLNLADISFILLDGINDPGTPQDQYSLEKISNLDRIHITNCNNLIDISSLADCILLSELHINNCNNLNKLSSLNECIFLSNLSIENSNNIDKSHVEELNIRSQKTISTTNYFRDCSQYLERRGQKIISAIHCFRDCTEEEKEQIKAIASSIKSIIFQQEIVQHNRDLYGFSQPCPDKVTELTISHNNNLTSLEGLLKNDNIRMLSLENLDNLKTLRGIDKLPNLKELCIFNLKNLTSLVGAKNLNKLRLLEVSNMSHFTDMKELSNLPFLKQLLIDGKDGRISSLEGVEKASSIELVELRSISATTHLQALEQLPNLKMVALTEDVGDNDAVLEHLKHLALPAGVKLLQASYSSDMDDSREDSYYLVELGCFNHQSQLASNMASMTEPQRDGLSRTVFVANQEFPLPPLSREYLEAQLSFKCHE